MLNFNSYNSHTQKVLGVPNAFSECKEVLRPKSLKCWSGYCQYRGRVKDRKQWYEKKPTFCLMGLHSNSNSKKKKGLKRNLNSGIN